MAFPDSPVRVRAYRDRPPSRWPRLVKWLLLIPNYVVLMVLWIAVTLVTVAFLATL